MTQEWEAEKLRAEWLSAFGIEIHDELPLGKISLNTCRVCGLDWFIPLNAASGRLYSQLEKKDCYRQQLRWEHKQALLFITGGTQVIDVGCGHGEFLQVVNSKGGVATGIEMNPEAVDQGRKEGLNIQVADVVAHSQKHTKAFDVVCSFQVIEHVPDPAIFLDAMHKMARSGGLLILAVPNADSYQRWLENILDMPPHHVTRWRPKVLFSIARQHGWKLVSLRYGPLEECHLGGWVNAFMNKYSFVHRDSPLVVYVMRRFASALVNVAWIRRLLQGENLFVCYRVT